MAYYKKYFVIALLALISLGCTNEESKPLQPVGITFTNFETSYNQVKLNWDITRSNGIIIQDLMVYRQSRNNDENYSQEELIGNLPSNETEIIDDNVPYQTEVSYKIRINYTDERTKPIKYLSYETEQKKYIRDIVIFDRVPFQVEKDPVQNNIFHILDKQGAGSMKRYNSIENKITDVKTFSDGSFLNNRFHFNNDEIYLADIKGKISRISTNDLKTIATYSTTITDRLNGFAVSGNRIYYQDKDIWCYYEIPSGNSINCGMVTSADYIEKLNGDDFLFLYCRNGNNGFTIEGFTPETCNGSDCMPIFHNNLGIGNDMKPNSVDANILSWNSSKSKFITSINGCVYNSNNLTQVARLNDVTGKHYFQFAFDSNNNIYATVQGEKEIHKFNSEYQLVDIIETKLYPLFPMVTNDNLSVIGSYSQVSYWDFGYGYNFDFNVKCAIEAF